jgi:hypothetical protein
VSVNFVWTYEQLKIMTAVKVSSRLNKSYTKLVAAVKVTSVIYVILKVSHGDDNL